MGLSLSRHSCRGDRDYITSSSWTMVSAVLPFCEAGLQRSNKFEVVHLALPEATNVQSLSAIPVVE